MLVVTKIFSQPQDFHPYPKGIIKPWYRLVLTDTCCFASTLKGAVTVFHIPIISVTHISSPSLTFGRDNLASRGKSISSIVVQSGRTVTDASRLLIGGWFLLLRIPWRCGHLRCCLWFLVIRGTNFKTNNTKMYFYLDRCLNCEVSAALLQSVCYEWHTS